MSEATEDISGEDVEQEADASYNQVLEEVGLEVVGGQTVPSTKIKGKGQESKVSVSDLEKKLNDLKG